MDKFLLTDRLLDAIANHSQLLILTLVMLLAFYPLLLLFKKTVVPLIVKFLDLKSSKYSGILKKHKILDHLVHVFFSFYLFFWSGIFDQAELLSPLALHIKRTLVFIYAMVFVTAILLELTNIMADVYKARSVSKKVPISLHTHIIKIIIVCCSILVVLSKIFVVSVGSLFASIGATAALFTFVFKDTVLGLVASLQLTFQDMIRVGDEVCLPSHDVEGEVEMITINLVKIRNTDNSVATIPTSALLANGFRNKRSIHENGSRMIKRSINIDMDTIKLCDQETLNKFKKEECMLEFSKNNPELFNAKNKVSNITIFRKYMNEYIKNHQSLHNEDFISLTRQLQSTAEGLPIEIYVYSKDTMLEDYEEVQASIFDHIFVTMPELGLKAYQIP
jgi:miniconductance mechanosensitive channel